MQQEEVLLFLSVLPHGLQNRKKIWELNQFPDLQSRVLPPVKGGTYPGVSSQCLQQGRGNRDSPIQQEKLTGRWRGGMHGERGNMNERISFLASLLLEDNV